MMVTSKQKDYMTLFLSTWPGFLFRSFQHIKSQKIPKRGVWSNNQIEFKPLETEEKLKKMVSQIYNEFHKKLDIFFGDFCLVLVIFRNCSA